LLGLPKPVAGRRVEEIKFDMSRKKGNGRAVAATAQALAAPASISVTSSAPSRAQPRPAERFWLEVVAIRISRWLGSLQIAVFLLIWFASVLAVGTVVESWYSGKVAQELVYRTWWFKLLLFLLGLNIFFAAAKKWPWKRHQTGFLITHVGLLLLVGGGVVTSFSGTDGLMSLVDTTQSDIQRKYGLPHESSQAIVQDEATIRIRRVSSGKEDESTREFRFEPGVLAWRPDQYVTAQVHPLLAVLNWLDHPFPPSWEANLGNGRRLTVLAYYPHAREEQYSPSKTGMHEVPAVKIRLKSAIFGRLPKDPWLALSLNEDQTTDFGPAMIEMLGRCPASLVGEFLNPPPAKELGSEGQLVLVLDGKVHRFQVDKSRGRSVAAGGYQLKITTYNPNFQKDGDGVTPAYPALEFDLTKDGKTSHYITLARYAGVAIRMEDGRPTAGDPNNVRVWYHPPDYRYGRGNQSRGLLQFAIGEAGELYYRSFSNSSTEYTGFGLEKSGQVSAGSETYPIWKGMNWEFQVKEYLPHAVAEPRLVPEDARPGLETERFTPAIRCQISTGDTKSEEFWISQGGNSSRVTVGKESYDVSYHRLTRPLDFDVKLLRAEQTVDAGTQQPASYTSYVQLTDAGSFTADWVPEAVRGITNLLGLTSGGDKIDGQDRVITMNRPLDHRGYKLYQSGYEFLRWDDRQKPVSYSAFTVARDPGLWLKYLGSTMLAVGIACMFYMKAYFFKPRRRASPAAAANS
jgi:hypothetical protein